MAQGYGSGKNGVDAIVAQQGTGRTGPRALSPDGPLIFAGHNPDEVNEILEKELKK